MRRRIFVVFACLAPLGWGLFWAVFHAVPGQDWVVFHTAARLVHTGDLRTLADPQAFTDLMNWTHRAWFARPVALHPWVYPPVTLLLALAVGGLPYPASLAVLVLASLSALLAALCRWQTLPRDRLMLVAGVLASAASAYTVGAGQLSFLVAAVVLAGMALLPRRPFEAGLVFSLLCLKPQFMPMIPVALLAGRHWRAIGGGLAGGAALILASVAVAGPRVWVTWIGFASGRDKLLGPMIAAMRTYDQSVHTCLRTLGATEAQAGAGQVLAMGAAALCVWLAFARPATCRQRLIVLLCALVFGAPHVGDYDEIMPVVAAMLVLLDSHARTWGRGEPLLAAGVWIATLVNPPALMAVFGVPVLTAAAALCPLLVAGLMLSAVPRTLTAKLSVVAV